MVSKFVSMALAFALVATVSFAAGESDSAGAAAAAEKKYVTDPTNGQVYTAPEYGGTLTYGAGWEPPNSDAMIGGIGAGSAASGVVEKLGIANWGIDRSVNNLANEFLLVDHFTGALAESWDVPDPQTYVFHIRQGVRWHDKAPMNGRELTAEDVVYNFNRWRTSDQNTRLDELPYESITATDRYTVEIKLQDPPLDVLLVLIDDNIAFMNAPEVIEQHGDVADWRNLVGTGPFMLTDWVEGSAITWAKNPDYWGHDEKYPDNRLPYVDEVVRLIMPDQATRVSAMRTGKIDYLAHNGHGQFYTVDAVESLERTNPELRVNAYYFRAGESAGFNVTMPPFDDIRVRHAIQMAIDLDTINTTYYKGWMRPEPMGSIQPFTGYSIPFAEWPEEVKQYYRYDPAGAEKLLDDAGYPRGADGIRFKTADTVLNPASIGHHEIVQGYLAEIGVEVAIRQSDWPTFQASFQRSDYEGMGNWSQGTPYRPLIILTGPSTGHASNVPGLSDPAYDALIEQLQVAATEEEYQRLGREADFWLVENHTFLWGGLNPWFNVTQPWVQGFAGDFYMGVWNKNAVYARLWIDQALKKEMGS